MRQASDTAKPVAAYIRVSTQDQRTALRDQIASVYTYASQERLPLEQRHVYIDEGVSGGKNIADRPSGGRLCKAIETGEVGAVIARDLDRLFRDTADSETTRRAWTAAGVGLHLIRMGGEQADDSLSRLLLTVQSALAEHERATIRKRVGDGNRNARARGVKMGRAPYGWAWSEDVYPDGRKRLLPVEAEQAIIQRVVEDKSSGISYRQLAKALTTETGSAWTPTKVRRIYLRAV